MQISGHKAQNDKSAWQKTSGEFWGYESPGAVKESVENHRVISSRHYLGPSDAAGKIDEALEKNPAWIVEARETLGMRQAFRSWAGRVKTSKTERDEEEGDSTYFGPDLGRFVCLESSGW